MSISCIVNYYRNEDYGEEWINKRLISIVDRFKLADIGEIAARSRRVAKGASDLYEEKTKRSAISKENLLNYQFEDDNKLIENK